MTQSFEERWDNLEREMLNKMSLSQKSLYFRIEGWKTKGKFNTGKRYWNTWNATTFSSSQFAGWYRWYKDDWKSTKRLLLHKDCPSWLIEKYAVSEVWYERIVALFRRKSLEDNWQRVLNDPHSFVRKAGYRTCWWLTDTEICGLISQDMEVLRDGRYQRFVEDHFLVHNEPAIALTSPDARLREWALEVNKATASIEE